VGANAALPEAALRAALLALLAAALAACATEGSTGRAGPAAHVNHLERFILRADDPRADDYSRFMGARAELVPDLLASVRHPVTKVLAVGEPPAPSLAALRAMAPWRGAVPV